MRFAGKNIRPKERSESIHFRNIARDNLRSIQTQAQGDWPCSKWSWLSFSKLPFPIPDFSSKFTEIVPFELKPEQKVSSAVWRSTSTSWRPLFSAKISKIIIPMTESELYKGGKCSAYPHNSKLTALQYISDQQIWQRLSSSCAMWGLYHNLGTISTSCDRPDVESHQSPGNLNLTTHPHTCIYSFLHFLTPNENPRGVSGAFVSD